MWCAEHTNCHGFLAINVTLAPIITETNEPGRPGGCSLDEKKKKEWRQQKKVMLIKER